MEPFEISEGVIVPPGTYDNTEAQIVFYTNRGAPVSFETRVVVGGFFDGERLALSPTLRFRIGDAFNTEIGWRYNDIDLESGAFETNLGLLRASYSFTPKIFIQGLVQYNDRADIWATNLRFGWLTRASAGLYLVYNEIQEIDGVGTVVALVPVAGETQLTIELPEDVLKYTVPRGSLTVNGVSLTVAELVGNVAQLAIIPYTLERTNLSRLTASMQVNLEADLIGKYVAAMMVPHS